jgi:hypothetical protein
MNCSTPELQRLFGDTAPIWRGAYPLFSGISENEGKLLPGAAFHKNIKWDFIGFLWFSQLSAISLLPESATRGEMHT